jgi:hypothetical protein
MMMLKRWRVVLETLNGKTCQSIGDTGNFVGRVGPQGAAKDKQYFGNVVLFFNQKF